MERSLIFSLNAVKANIEDLMVNRGPNLQKFDLVLVCIDMLIVLMIIIVSWVSPQKLFYLPEISL